MHGSKDNRSYDERRADHLLDWWEGEALKHHPEVRRDALYAPALVPGGAYDGDEQLERILRLAKDRGALRTPKAELVYVYARVPVWTIRPSAWVRDVGQWMELRRNRTANERLARSYPPGGPNEALANGVVSMLDYSVKMLTPGLPPTSDPVLTRIDARPGLADTVVSIGG